MTSTRTALTLLALIVFTGASALAGPPVGVPPVVPVHPNVPPVNAPPVNAPPVSVPAANHAPQPNPNANANLSSQGSGTVQQGTLTAVNGTTVTLRLSNGKTQTYAVSAQTAEELRASIGKPLAFRVQNGVLVVAGHEGNPPVHGTLTMLNGTNARVRLANGTVQTFTVTAQQAAQLKARVGKSIVFWTAANGTLRLDRRTRTSRQGEKSH